MNERQLPGNRLTRRSLLYASGATGVLAATTLAGCDLSTDPAGDDNGTGGGEGADTKEAPMLAELVDSGDLPPLEERLPDEPLVVEPVDEVGVYGGEWNTALLGPADSAWLYRTIGYDQLMTWDRDFTEPMPNIATSIDVGDDGREFTINLRPGMKWSDGEPFTADDIMFAFEDVLSNDELPVTVPDWLTAEGEPAVFEKVDEHTVVVRFAISRGLFLSHLAAPEGNTLTAWPKHHFSQFHADYNDDVETLAEDEGFSGWVELFEAHTGLGGLTEDPFYQYADTPTLRPWVVKTPLGSGTRVTLERNPYYWKVDPDGRQLPYLDGVVYDVIEEEEPMLLKANNGEIDMHVRHINTLPNKPVLAQNREGGDYRFFDVVNSSMNFMMIALNLAHQDPVKREIFQNKDFRIGLSHAINREELIDVVFQRQGEPWQGAPRQESEFYDEELAKQYTEYDVDLANEHLDSAGFSERDGDGFRLGPDGNRIRFAVDVATGLSPFWVDAMDRIRDHWQEVGIDIQVNSMDRSLMYDRKEGNEHDANVWGGDAGLTDAIMDPRWYMPNGGEANYAIPWAAWYTGGDESGIAEEPPEATRRQMELYDEFRAESDDEARAEIFREILQIAKEEFYAIGTVLTVGDYGIVKNNFHNVPDPMPAAWVFPQPGPLNPEQFFLSGE